MRAVVKVGTILSLLTLMVRTPAAAQPRRVEPARSAALGRSCANWRVVPAPTDREEGIAGIDGVSASDFWAVVDSFEAPHPQKILHWHGGLWTQPPIVGKRGDLKGVVAIAPTDAWAVGTDSEYIGTQSFHWDGTVWTQVPVPSPEGGYDILYGVSASSSSDVWAVGVTGYSRGLIVHWDGKAWSAVPNPVHQSGEEFRGVLALSPTDAWAVGGRDIGETEKPLIEHWDGSSWTELPIPQPEHGGVLFAVDAAGPDHVWAVGLDNGFGTLIYRWDGTSWTMPDRAPFANRGELRSVSVLASDDVWVAGLNDGGGPPIAAHWDGRRWKLAPANVGNQWFDTVKAFTHTSVWAGGGGAYGIIAARFAGCR